MEPDTNDKSNDTTPAPAPTLPEHTASSQDKQQDQLVGALHDFHNRVKNTTGLFYDAANFRARYALTTAMATLLHDFVALFKLDDNLVMQFQYYTEAHLNLIRETQFFDDALRQQLVMGLLNGVFARGESLEGVMTPPDSVELSPSEDTTILAARSSTMETSVGEVDIANSDEYHQKNDFLTNMASPIPILENLQAHSQESQEFVLKDNGEENGIETWNIEPTSNQPGKPSAPTADTSNNSVVNTIAPSDTSSQIEPPTKRPCRKRIGRTPLFQVPLPTDYFPISSSSTTTPPTDWRLVLLGDTAETRAASNPYIAEWQRRKALEHFLTKYNELYTEACNGNPYLADDILRKCTREKLLAFLCEVNITLSEHRLKLLKVQAERWDVMRQTYGEGVFMLTGHWALSKAVKVSSGTFRGYFNREEPSVEVMEAVKLLEGLTPEGGGALVSAEDDAVVRAFNMAENWVRMVEPVYI